MKALRDLTAMLSTFRPFAFCLITANFPCCGRVTIEAVTPAHAAPNT